MADDTTLKRVEITGGSVEKPEGSPSSKRPAGGMDEYAVLIINGQEYKDWTSINVEVRWTEYFSVFQFDCTEFDDKGLANKNFSQAAFDQNMKIVPGDTVEVRLAGVLALSGYVTQRHVAYDARNHGVRIIGKAKTFDLVVSSVWSQGGSYDNQSWEQLAQQLIKPFGIKLKTKGQIDGKPYEQIQVQPGELVASALERYARQRNILLGSTEKGELLAIGEHAATETDRLVEGVNILRCSGVIVDENVYKKIFAIGQRNGNDQVNMDQANKMVAEEQGSSKRERTRVTVMDLADDEHGAKQRAKMEKLFTEGAMLDFNITVQGWLRKSGGIWKAGEYYWVRSPMALLDKLLGCKSIVYAQDNAGGTTTTLNMVLPEALKGKPDMSGQST